MHTNQLTDLEPCTMTGGPLDGLTVHVFPDAAQYDFATASHRYVYFRFPNRNVFWLVRSMPHNGFFEHLDDMMERKIFGDDA